jgi:hypothetical protein
MHGASGLRESPLHAAFALGSPAAAHASPNHALKAWGSNGFPRKSTKELLTSRCGDFRCKVPDVTSHERLRMTNKEILEAWIKRYGRPPSSITRWFDGHKMVIEIVDEAETLRPLWFWA